MEAKKAIAIKKIQEFWPLSTEQIERLDSFVSLLLGCNAQYNLIGKSTESEIWERHIVDSAQLLKYLDDLDLLGADFGSGAGFPGMVLSILGLKKIYLIEKSFRKCQFLEQARKISPNQVFIEQKTIEELSSDLNFGLIFSRALAPLDNLLGMVKPFMKDDTRALFLKGQNLSKELALAKNNNQFIYTIYPSVTSPESGVIVIEKLT